jgi:hypothetical protein
MFGMALIVSDEELGLVKEVAEHAYSTLTFANDYISWQKEYDEFCKSQGSSSMANAVWIIMKEHSVDIEVAKTMCVEMIRDSCRAFREEKERFESEFGHKVSKDLLKYLGALETAISGNVVWGQHSERYNFKAADGNAQTTESMAASSSCSSCGSSTSTVPIPNSSDLEEASQNKPKAVHESLDMDLPELSDAVHNDRPQSSAKSLC